MEKESKIKRDQEQERRENDETKDEKKEFDLN
jgi:hypothetical protein